MWRKIERDLDEEENTILQLEDFWNRYVLSRVEPPLVEKPDMVLDAIRRYQGEADKSKPKITIGKEFIPALEQILDLKARKSSLDRESKKLDGQIKQAYAPIAEKMGTACLAHCEDGGVAFEISFNPKYRTGITKEKLAALQAQYPDIYDDFVDVTESRVFSLTKAVS